MTELTHPSHWFLRDRARPEKKRYARQMRNHPTPQEEVFWQRVRRYALGQRFKRQAIIRGWIVDFYCPEARLVVEIDGLYHMEPKRAAEDRRRDAVMRRLDLEVMRFTNQQVETDLESVLERVANKVKERQR